ncbi:tyrosine-protein phosphatase non-receptor type substrate 1-like isoform X2 [Mustelus asterias]
MLNNKLVLCFTIVGIIHGGTSIRVIQLPESLTKIQGTTVTFHCSVPYPPDDSNVTFNWLKEGESQYLSTAADHRKVFGSKTTFSGFLRITNVSFQDAGVYYCSVQQRGYITGNTIGSNLTVWAPPSQVQILPSDPRSDSSVSLVCQATAFYPEIIALEWYKGDIEISTGVSVLKQQNSDGLYEARSFWEESQPAPIGSVYSCLVSHVTLETPLVVTHVITYSNADSQFSRLLLISGCIGYGLICLLFSFLIWKRRQLKDL